MNPFQKLIAWVKQHKLTTVLIAVLLYVLLQNSSINPFSSSRTFQSSSPYLTEEAIPMMGAAPAGKLGVMEIGSYDTVSNYEAPPSDSVNRMVVQNSYLSLLVKEVKETLQSIKKYTETAGGYMVESSLNNPDEAANGNITVRVPQDSLDETLDYFRSLGVKVVSENLSGTDVTDQYEDIEEKIRLLENNKARFEQIMTQATEVSDILTVQREILSLQSQIDALKGRQKYLEQNVKLTKVTVYMSTDELELPYAPSEAWRPELIFKNAVRSLILNARKVGTLGIYLVVWAVVWIPIVLIILFIRKRRRTKLSTPTSSK